MFTIFAVGSVLFWILMACISLLMLVTVEYEKPGWATLSLIVTFVLLAFLGNFNILNQAMAHPVLTVLFVLGYFALGTLWSVVKWWFYVHNRAEKLKEIQADYFAIKGYNPNYKMSSEEKQKFLSGHPNGWFRGYEALDFATRPLARENKSRILTWMIYFPWSAIWTLINDPVKKLFKMIFLKIQSIFEGISKHAYKDIDFDK